MNDVPVATLIISSLISGLVGVGVSAWFFARMERRRLKIDTARRVLGSRHKITGDEFKTAMNEVLIVFAKSPKVTAALQRLYESLAAPGKPNVDDRFTEFLKAMCNDLRIAPKHMSDAYYLRTFSGPASLSGSEPP